MRVARESDAADGSRGSIWIDLDNTPHVPFFAPIIRALRQREYAVGVTARDAYQVRALAELLDCDHETIGRHFGKHKPFKIFGTVLRGLQLVPFAKRVRPDLAVAHGSRSQLLTSALLRIPSLTIFDYEFTASLAAGRPTWMMVPEVLARSSPRFDSDVVLRYPGIKEDVYASDFTPDPSLRSQLGLNGNHLVVTVRPPATDAHYHSVVSDRLFDATMGFLRERPDATVILLPRTEQQRAALLTLCSPWPAHGRVVVLDRAVHGLNLIWHSDLVISGGGTMNREAAALGVPVYSIFGGRTGAVDRFLADSGRLTLLNTADDVRARIALRRRKRVPVAERGPSAALTTIVNHIAALTDGIVSAAQRHAAATA